MPAERIGDRRQPLEENTRRRIEIGLKRFVVDPFLTVLNKWDDRFAAMDQPMPVQTTTNGLALVLPYIVELHRTSTARSISEPRASVCAGGNHHGLVVSPGLPPGWWLNYNSNGSLHPLTDALGALPTHDRFALVQSGTEIAVDDCRFRMLTPPEIKAAMAFPRDYVITGNKKEQVYQLGQAVTPPVMRMLMERCIASLN